MPLVSYTQVPGDKGKENACEGKSVTLCLHLIDDPPQLLLQPPPPKAHLRRVKCRGLSNRSFSSLVACLIDTDQIHSLVAYLARVDGLVIPVGFKAFVFS